MDLSTHYVLQYCSGDFCDKLGRVVLYHHPGVTIYMEKRLTNQSFDFSQPHHKIM